MAAAPAKSAEARPAEAAADAAPPGGGGGIKAFLPLILNIVLMPVLAYAMTLFVLMPKLQGPSSHADGEEHAAEGGDHGGGGGHGSGSSAKGGGHGAKGGKAEIMAPLGGKILVNVSGTGGSRYLLGSFTLVGSKDALKQSVESNDAKLRDKASTILANKTISDLEKPGARTLIRTELIAAFNNIFGAPLVEDIYFTEFAIQ